MTSTNTSRKSQNAKNFRKWQGLVDMCAASVVGDICWGATLSAFAFTLSYGKESTVGTMRTGVHSIPWFQGAKKKDLF